MRFTEMVLETYTHGMKGGSYSLTPATSAPITPPPPNPRQCTLFKPYGRDPEQPKPSLPTGAPPRPLRSPHSPLIIGSFPFVPHCSWLLTKSTARRSFENISPDVSRLCLSFSMRFLTNRPIEWKRNCFANLWMIGQNKNKIIFYF